MDTPLLFLLTLHLEGIGPLRLRRWLTHFKNNLEDFFSADLNLLHQLGLSETDIEAVKNVNWKAAERDLTWCEKNNCHIVTYLDERYPFLLNQFSDAPLVLFVKGKPEILSQPQLAMVGSRNPTETGREIAKEFAYCLSKTGLIITSGLALGIDAASHQGALLANQPTIAVLGSGLGHIYPRSNSHLAEKISQEGALVSEFPPLTKPRPHFFPLRNRLISGLSLGVFVVEATLKSGSLITADFALEQGREVFALPSSIHNPLARGCHKLIKQGAKLVETANDIVEELGILKAVTENQTLIKPSLSSDQYRLLKQIGYEITYLDVIIKRSGLTTERLSSMLLALELEGYITFSSGGYIRNPLKKSSILENTGSECLKY